MPLPATVKPGDYIRAEGDMPTKTKDINDSGAEETIDAGLGDNADGDMCWYMIDSISADRRTITLASPYMGARVPEETHGHSNITQIYQPASVSSSVVSVFDTAIGAF